MSNGLVKSGKRWNHFRASTAGHALVEWVGTAIRQREGAARPTDLMRLLSRAMATYSNVCEAAAAGLLRR